MCSVPSISVGLRVSNPMAQRAERFQYTGWRWGVSGAKDRICFTVDQSDVSIKGVGVYLGKEKTTATVEFSLKQVSPDERQLATVSKSLESDGSDKTYNVCFEESYAIEKGVRYMVDVKFRGTENTYRGTGGAATVRCDDGVTFTFYDPPTRHNGNKISHGQLPVILYSRGEWPSKSSFRRTTTEMRLPLQKEEFDQSSEPMKLNRFRFTVFVKKENRKVETTVKCQPITEFAGWSVEGHVMCRLVHPTSQTKSFKCMAMGGFNAAVQSLNVFSLDTYKLADWDAAKEAVLETTIRYAKASSPPDVPAEDELAFSDPWRGSDLVLAFDDGQKLHCHKQILSLASPVFNRMLDGDFKEKQESTIQLPGKTASAFEKLLRFIYPRERPLVLNYEEAILLAEVFHE